VPRIPAVDLLRGLVMVIMAIDHTRDYVHSGAMLFPPEDLARTTPAIFFTRWITHFCAPAFMFCAGLGASFRLTRDGNRASLSRFLVTRGLWLIALEFTAVRIAFFFEFAFDPIFLLVFWALGWSMIALAALIHLPWRALLAVSLSMVVLHNLTDRVAPAAFGSLDSLWRVLHVPGPLTTDPLVLVAYPLVPWIGVMALGFCSGRLYALDADRRRRLLWWMGLTAIAGFVILRSWNLYGDPRHWAPQSSQMFSLMSFLNASKYPPSLQFLLMTLGPTLMFLALVDRIRPGERNPLLVFGRVPLLYFVLHLAVIHATAIALTALTYGTAPFLFVPPPTLGTPPGVYPADYGWDLWVTYAVTAVVVAALYPVCLWFARLKARRRAWWLSYL
jgi:uncharacterized membrane protein